MKTTNLNTRSYKQLKPESKDINASELGITRRLLEKYKPKCCSNVEYMSDKSIEKRVA